mmetsp:Transcript_7062/g.12154  ORF Transcript_7062/g.12154 Transcript_7062/m.12154 type:complete len:314 (-) Transcript_7062:50-991(-)
MPSAFHQVAVFSAAGLIIVATCTSHTDRTRRLCLKADAAGSTSVEVLRAPKSAIDSQEQKQLLRKATTSGRLSGTWSGGHRRRTTLLADSSNNSKVHIQVYYETRCPYCVSFLNATLGSFWQKSDLKSNVNISLYPYGNAQTVLVSNVSMGYKFWHPKVEQSKITSMSVCQHGKDECFGNLIQACAIHLEPQDVHMDFIVCMSARVEDSFEKSSYECMEEAGMDKAKMKDCVMGEQGSNITNEMAMKTEAVHGRVGTPWILVDGQNLENPDELQKAVCEILDYGPTSCTKYADPEDGFPVMFQNMLDVLPKRN